MCPTCARCALAEIDIAAREYDVASLDPQETRIRDEACSPGSIGNTLAEKRHVTKAGFVKRVFVTHSERGLEIDLSDGRREPDH